MGKGRPFAFRVLAERGLGSEAGAQEIAEPNCHTKSGQSKGMGKVMVWKKEIDSS